MGSTVPRRQLGRTLRQLRLESQVTLDGAAEALECSRQKVWRVECGLGSVRGVDVRAMCDLYGVAPELVDALVGLASETKAKGWWHAYADAIPDWFELYVGLESAAARIRRFDESLIPGLLQTRDYARAVYQHRSEVTEDERERLVEVRLQRQALLTRRLPPAPCESWTGALYLDREGEFAAYEQVWVSLDALALDGRQSRHLIGKIIGEVHHS
jgi:transcriptional regulator with XRE-family HTH domain